MSETSVGNEAPSIVELDDIHRRQSSNAILLEIASDNTDSSSRLQFSTMTKGTPTDPDTMPAGQSQWHLVDTWGLQAHRVWNDYTGTGVMVGVMDDGFQYTHSELTANYRTDLDRDAFTNDADAAPAFSDENHGTSVIGTIIADDNGAGGVGVAFDAQGYGIRIDLHGRGGTLNQIISGYQYAKTTGLDVMNNSWGMPNAFGDTIDIDFSGLDFRDLRAAMVDLVEDGRGGLGSNIVFAAGNARTTGDDVNLHNITNSPYTIAVAAIDQDGTYSAFSTPGAALLVAAGGTSIFTTDRSGSAGYGATDYTNFSGTSAAAPIVSGAIAVMLEANSDLGWRDVQEILAYSSHYNDPTSAGWQYNGAGNWNGGGLHFSHDYGFGAVDLFTAVRLAETWNLQQTSANMTTTGIVTSSAPVSIPATGTITSSINFAQDIEIEHAIVYLDITHAKAGDLVVTLISPDGTESVLINHVSNGAFTTSVNGVSGIHHETMSNAHWGESSSGTWTLRVSDTVSGNAGILNSWKLSFTGNAHTADDTYFYTNDYANFTGAEATARASLSDSSGTDTLNLAAVTTNTTLNMNGGVASTVAGKALTIASGTIIENAFLGDGNDIVTGNSANNIIYGGRGSDTVDGGTGNDTFGYFDAITNYSFNFVNSTTVHITSTIGTIWTDILSNFENFLFDTVNYTRSELESYAGVPSNTTGTNNNDTLNGASGADVISGLNGNDTIHGNGGNDTINGDAGNDFLYGDSGNDSLNGGIGSDTMVGGTGDDSYVVDVITDIVTELANEGTDTVTTGITYTLSANVENLILSGANAVNGTGNDLDNSITGNSSNNILNGGLGNDNLIGGLGNDTYIVDSSLDVITEALNAGTELVQSSASYILSANLENLTLTGTGNINGTGNSLVNIITGNNGNNILDGGLGADRLTGGLGDDTYIIDVSTDILVESANAGTDTVQVGFTYTLLTNFENLVLTGTSALNGTGNSANNTLTGNSGNNTLNGLTGADSMIGGAGNDLYIVDNIGDTITENLNEGTDTVQSSVTHVLSANVENLTITGASAVNGTGNSLDNILIGNTAANILNGGSGNDTINGGSGSDTMIGGAGNDSYTVDVASDVITELANEGTDTVTTGITYTLSANVENLVLTGIGAVNGTGNASDNAITGNSANNILNGGAGNDTLTGGLGNDTYIVDSALDIIVEAASAGTDTVQASASYILAANIEYLTLTGTGNIDGTGNSLVNIITGNSGNNILDGGLGNDTLKGGLGNDTYIIDSTADIITEGSNAGTDTVQTSLSYTLITNLENLTLTGTGNVNATGNTVSNVLRGNIGNNVLNGGTGADTMIGGGGNDTYVVDNTLDVITEVSGEGTDLVQSSVTFTLSAHVENLTLTGTSAINGTGNDLNNILTGNAGANILNGGLGNDTMAGGSGNDTYYVDSLLDVVTELSGGGTDHVYSSVSYVLGNNLENLTLTGSDNINATGNSFINVITGTSGDNILDGGLGGDRLNGGLGNDTYYIDTTADIVVEALNSGTDTVHSTVTYTIAAHVENLILLGSTAISGTGNDLDNIITGNSANNSLNGGSNGNDTLYGGGGSDTLTGGIGNDVLYGQSGLDTLSGGTGSDRFVFEAANAFDAIDRVTDFKLTENDILDISDIVTGFNLGDDVLTDYLQITNGSGGSVVSIDRDGLGSTYGFTQIATLSSITNITDESALVTSGHLVI